MKDYSKIFLTMMFLVAGICTAFAQQTITGKVVDATDVGLPGVSIVVKGTTQGTITNFDGEYTIDNVASEAILIFSFVGFTSQEIEVGNQTVINVKLEEDIAELDEVVVVGYGTVKKQDATAAIDQVSSDDFTAIAASSPAELLRGKVSGVQITQSSGEPGAASRIRVRGISSVRSGNDPLFVVDGVPLSGGDISSGGSDIGFGNSSARSPLNFINQNDIESISILKDASATAIYGSRGANGVILITTKKGKGLKTQVTYNATASVGTLARDIDMLTSSEFKSYASDKGFSGIDGGSDGYEWSDAILRTSFSNTHDVAVQQSSEKSNYRISIGYFDQEGIVEKTGLKKYSATITNSNKLFDNRLTFDANLMVTHMEDQAQALSNDSGFEGNLMGAALYWNPTTPLYDSDGSYHYVSDTYLNPVELLEKYDDETSTSKVLGSLAGTINIAKGLNYKMLFGIEHSTSSRAAQIQPSFRKEGLYDVDDDGNITKGGQATISDVVVTSRTFENTITYDKDFNDVVFNGVAGFSYYKYSFNGHSTSAEKFSGSQVNLVDNIEGGKQDLFRSESYRNAYEVQSFFARANLTILEDILVTATVRADGSSKFGENNKYGYFPSLGVGYKLISNSDGILNNLKLRGNWGITGNQEFPNNAATLKLRYGNNGTLSTENNANADLKWETTTSYGIGADFALIEYKLSGSVDYFFRETEDLIFPTPLAATQPSPGSTRYVNLPGKLTNNGIELGLKWSVINKDDVNWEISGNVSFLNNEIKDYTGFNVTGNLHGQGLSGAYSQVITNNYPLYNFYLYDWVGFESDGSSIYLNAAGEETSLGLAAKRMIDAQPLPKVNLGISSTFNYKNFDVSVSGYGSYGHYVYNNTRNAMFFMGAFAGGRNVTLDVAQSAQGDGDPNTPSTLYLEKADFFRLANLTFGYTFDDIAPWLSTVRAYVAGQNLFLITDYTGFDPEVDTDKARDGVPSAGIEYLPYPSTRTFTFGLNVTF